VNLREEIEGIKIIDGHLHAVDPWYWMSAVGSYAFEELVAKLPVPDKYTTITRTRTLMRCYREIWDFPYDELTPENTAELNRLYSESRKDEAAYVMKAFDKAGIDKGLQMCLSSPVLPPGLDADRFARAQLVDGFLIPLDNSGIGTTMREKQFVKMTEYFPGIIREEMKPQSFDEYLAMISTTLDELAGEGVAALKMNFAYWRDIAVDVVDKDEAEDVFAKKDNSPRRYKVLQDYILRHLIAKAATLGLPIHIHVGPTGVTKPMETTSPARFDPFLWLPDIKPAKIVLLHGCYPYTRESGFMVSRMGDVPDLYLDVSLMWYWVPGAPESLVPIFRDWILAGLVPRMIYGSDSPSLIGIMLSALNARATLYLTLQGLVDEGSMTESQALEMATAIFRENAKALYQGKL
jgi:predicted TIM-barrel fold metal-dependent hydrolase